MLRWVGGKDTSSAILSGYIQLVAAKSPDGIWGWGEKKKER